MTFRAELREEGLTSKLVRRKKEKRVEKGCLGSRDRERFFILSESNFNDRVTTGQRGDKICVSTGEILMGTKAEGRGGSTSGPNE